MPYEPVVDIEALLAPIAGANSSGQNLLYSGAYDQIRSARQAEADLPQGEWTRKVKSADWNSVKGLAITALATETKDLQIAAWLAEALIQLHSFAGLLDSLRLFRGLLAEFWDNLYPEIDDGDLEGRANALSFFDARAAVLLKGLPLTNSASVANCSFLQWEESKRYEIPEDLSQLDSEEIDRVRALREEAAREGKVTSEQWRVAHNDTPYAHYERLQRQLGTCRQEFAELDATIDEKFGRQTPGLPDLKRTLEEVASLVERLVREKRMLEPEQVVVESAAAHSPDQAPQRGTAASRLQCSAGPIQSRADALQRLEEVTAYFRQAEPHSPVAYLVERAIRWGKMPLELWLKEVVKERQVLDQLRDTLGLESPADNDDN